MENIYVSNKGGSVAFDEALLLSLAEDETALLAPYSHNVGRCLNGVREESLSYGEPVLYKEQLPLFRKVKEAVSPFYSTRGRRCFTFVDLFAGIGGFRYALQEVGGECLYSSEWDRHAKLTYMMNYGQIPYGDITLEETKSHLPESFDVLTAGFPCQPFSISGLKKGFEDTRGTLIYDVFQILERYEPPVVLLENVKHLVHHDKGNTLRVILKHLSELGYVTKWAILNASQFGLPQNRERIIIVGSKGGKEFDFSSLQANYRLSPDLRLKDFLDEVADPSLYLDEEWTLIEEPKRQPSGLIFAGYRNKTIRKVGVREGTEHLSRVHKQPNRIYSSEGVHPALSAQETSGRYWILDEGRVRKLSLDECYRIMGFPPDFQRMGAQSEQYRQIGNSVAIPMVKAVMKEILEQDLI